MPSIILPPRRIAQPRPFSRIAPEYASRVVFAECGGARDLVTGGMPGTNTYTGRVATVAGVGAVHPTSAQTVTSYGGVRSGIDTSDSQTGVALVRLGSVDGSFPLFNVMAYAGVSYGYRFQLTIWGGGSFRMQNSEVFQGGGLVSTTITNSVNRVFVFVWTRRVNGSGQYDAAHYADGVQVGASSGHTADPQSVGTSSVAITSTSDGDSTPVVILMRALLRGAMTPAQVAKLSANPWQLFAANRSLYYPPRAVQLARPIYDVSNTGWTGVTL